MARNAAAIGQPKELEKIDQLKKRLVGTDRDDHWQELLDKEKAIKDALLKRDLSKHRGMKMLIEWVTLRIRDANDLLTRAKSKDLTDAQRDGLIEVRDFMIEFLRFIDPRGVDLAEINKDLDYQLSGEEDEDSIPEEMLSDKEDPADAVE